MPTINDFIKGFGWPELIFTLLIAVAVIWIREKDNIVRIFGGGKKEKKTSLHSEE